jgi:hypothetical protein
MNVAAVYLASRRTRCWLSGHSVASGKSQQYTFPINETEKKKNTFKSVNTVLVDYNKKQGHQGPILLALLSLKNY